MIAELAKVENSERERQLVEFLKKRGGSEKVKKILTSSLNINAVELDKVVKNLESSNQVEYLEGLQTLRLIETDIDDEYTLQPDEMTKEMVRAELGFKNVRSVEMLKKNGDIPAQKLRRRVDGEVRQQVIFKREDVLKFKTKSDSPVNIPTVEKSNAMEKAKSTEQSEFLNASQVFVAEKLLEAANIMQSFTKQLPGAAAPMGDDKPKFLTVEQASNEYGLAQAEIKRLIKDGVIRGFTGSKGETLVSRKQIENL